MFIFALFALFNIISSSQNQVTSLNSENNSSTQPLQSLEQINENRRNHSTAFNEVIIKALRKENNKFLYLIDRDKKIKIINYLNGNFGD